MAQSSIYSACIRQKAITYFIDAYVNEERKPTIEITKHEHGNMTASIMCDEETAQNMYDFLGRSLEALREVHSETKGGKEA